MTPEIIEQIEQELKKTERAIATIRERLAGIPRLTKKREAPTVKRLMEQLSAPGVIALRFADLSPAMNIANRTLAFAIARAKKSEGLKVWRESVKDLAWYHRSDVEIPQDDAEREIAFTASVLAYRFWRFEVMGARMNDVVRYSGYGYQLDPKWVLECAERGLCRIVDGKVQSPEKKAEVVS